ncbi:chemotaxis protein CheB [Sphingomonas sp.]|uniref:chemotaxis protein CheB n=1 Tax=Sphingomonas sp. TaxID=28214 RepID=UPI003B00F1A1
MALVTKVLVVDDSLTMRALISGALEKIPGVKIVGLADGAAEARKLVAEHNPDVITLDVEMPGTSGIQYLAEVMETRPIPVIMFSTRTEAGASETIEALRLGAIDCFPKPKVASSAELNKIIEKLGKRIKSAKSVEVRKAAPAAAAVPAIEWNGRLAAIGADAANTKALFELFAGFPANCPPTLVVQHLGPGLVASMVAKLAGQSAARVVVAEDGMAVEQGTIYFAPQGDAHMIVDAWPDGHIRLLRRDPVSGERPSISVLFASLAKAAGVAGLGALIAPEDDDGAAGLSALAAAGGATLAREKDGFRLTRRQSSQLVPAPFLGQAMLKLSAR